MRFINLASLRTTLTPQGSLSHLLAAAKHQSEQIVYKMDEKKMKEKSPTDLRGLSFLVVLKSASVICCHRGWHFSILFFFALLTCVECTSFQQTPQAASLVKCWSFACRTPRRYLLEFRLFIWHIWIKVLNVNVFGELQQSARSLTEPVDCKSSARAFTGKG